jgi:hypothetical protein
MPTVTIVGVLQATRSSSHFSTKRIVAEVEPSGANKVSAIKIWEEFLVILWLDRVAAIVGFMIPGIIVLAPFRCPADRDYSEKT